MLIVVPNGAVFSQWQEKIWSKFQDSTLIISNEDKPSDPKFLSNWVSTTAMRVAPAQLDKWPVHLRYIFDVKDARASKTVILSPYDSHASRTMQVEWITRAQPTAETEGWRRSDLKSNA